MSRLIRASLLVSALISCASSHRILNEVPLIDGHNDLPNNLYELAKNKLSYFYFDKNLTTDPVWGKKACSDCYTDLPRLRKGKVGGQFWVAYVDCNTQYKDSMARTLEQIDVIKRLIRKYPNDLELVTNADQIMGAFTRRKIASLIGVEGGHSIDSRLGALRSIYELGARYMTLTHSCNTPWADNSYVDDDKPVHNLTAFGVLVVKEMNRLGMLVDLSHVSHAVMNQAIDASRAPVMFSHSSAYSVYKHNRNVRDDTLKLVKNNNGIVMVNFYPGFISSNPKNASIEDVAKHINYISDVAGMDHVGIGADYDGVEIQPIGLEDVSKYPDLFVYLQNKNPNKWTDENLKKLASGNFIRVFKDVEAIRDKLENEDPQETWIPDVDLNQVEETEQLWKCRTHFNVTSPSPRSSGNTIYVTTSILLFGLSLLSLVKNIV